MGEYLSREAILSADDIPTEDVPVEEWSGVVRVRALTGAERDKFEAAIAGNGRTMNLSNLRAKFCAACMVTEAGEPLFGTADVAELGKKSAAALDRVFTVGRRLSGLSDADVEELTGESEPGLNGSSTSVSPGISA